MDKKVKINVNSPSNDGDKIALLGDLPQSDTSKKWLQAAEDARLKISGHKKKIRLLEEAIRTFEQYAQSGERWPQGG